MPSCSREKQIVIRFRQRINKKEKNQNKNRIEILSNDELQQQKRHLTKSSGQACVCVCECGACFEKIDDEKTSQNKQNDKVSNETEPEDMNNE